MSQHNLHQIIRQQQKQLIVIQAQIQALLAVGEAAAVVGGPNTGSNIEIAKPLVFSGEVERVGRFIMACRL